MTDPWVHIDFGTSYCTVISRQYQRASRYLAGGLKFSFTGLAPRAASPETLFPLFAYMAIERPNLRPETRLRATAKRTSLWVSTRHDHARPPEPSIYFQSTCEPCAAIPAGWRWCWSDHESPRQDDSRGDREPTGHRPLGGLRNAGAGHHSSHLPRPTVDRHSSRVRNLGAHLRNSDWTSTETRA